jgi:replicative DNA helicase
MESLFLQGLMFNEDYGRRVLPFLKEEYFESPATKKIFDTVRTHILKYNTPPTIETISVDLDTAKMPSELYNVTVEKLRTLREYVPQTDVWLTEQTEKWCQRQAIIRAIHTGIQIIQGEDKGKELGVLPDIMRDALSISFNQSVGHNFVDDSEVRYSGYQKTENVIPFDIDILNQITNGGVPKKTLNIVMSSTGGGKSLFLCHLAAAYWKQNQNVLYCTFELSKEKTAERFDANLLNTPINSLKFIPYDSYASNIGKLAENTTGRLIIEEYPMSSASVLNIQRTLDELKIKKNFVPDVIMLDYLAVMASARVKASASQNMYAYVKAIAEEIRGLATRTNTIIWTACQTNRSGFKATDVDMDSMSDSWGINNTADFLMALIPTDEYAQKNQILAKLLKSRYNETLSNKRFLLGMDKPRMRIYDVEKMGATQNDEETKAIIEQKLRSSDKDKFGGFVL